VIIDADFLVFLPLSEALILLSYGATLSVRMSVFIWLAKGLSLRSLCLILRRYAGEPWLEDNSPELDH